MFAIEYRRYGGFMDIDERMLNMITLSEFIRSHSWFHELHFRCNTDFSRYNFYTGMNILKK